MIISCRHYVSLVTDAREGALSRWNKTRFAIHRGMCVYCRGYEASLDATLEVLGDSPPEPPSEKMQTELLERLRVKSKAR